jgi:hypothetical protein
MTAHQFHPLNGGPAMAGACAQDRMFRPASVTTFRISITRADGHTTERMAVGGNSISHTQAAMDEAGIGGVVRVICTTLQGGQP